MINIIETSSFCCPKSQAKENQDSILSPKRFGEGVIFSVADGVGSYNGAKLASDTAIAYLDNITSFKSEFNISDIFINVMNKIVDLSKVNSDFCNAATTLTFCLATKKGLHIGHIGDCRLYIKYGQKLKQITSDHTQYQMLIDNALFTKKQLKDKGEKAKSILTTALSQNVEMKFDELFIPYEELPIENGILSLFIMSDGAHHFWEKRPRFSQNTMNNISNFSSSFKKRIEREAPIDDYSLVAVSLNINQLI